jgi:hypothetical protein
MSNYDKVDQTYSDALDFGDKITDAQLYPQEVWDAYQTLLAELRRVRISTSVDDAIADFVKSGILEVR